MPAHAVLTLLGTDIALSLIKQRSARAARLLEGAPLVLVKYAVLERNGSITIVPKER